MPFWMSSSHRSSRLRSHVRDLTGIYQSSVFSDNPEDERSTSEEWREEKRFGTPGVRNHADDDVIRCKRIERTINPGFFVFLGFLEFSLAGRRSFGTDRAENLFFGEPQTRR